MPMRKIFLLQFIFVFCTTNIAFASFPDWFVKKNIEAEEHEVIGYGVGKTLEEAIDGAKKDIALFESRPTVRILNRSKEGKNTSIQWSIQWVKVDIVVTDTETIKQEPREGEWYVAVKCDNQPFEKKFAKKMRQPCGNEKQNRYLQQTPLVKAINKELKCEPDLRILRKNNVWYMSYNKLILPLTNDYKKLYFSSNLEHLKKILIPSNTTTDFKRLFVSTSSDTVIIKPLQDEILEGSELNFIASAKRDGYISLIGVYENGEVFVVSANQQINPNKELIIPDPSNDHEIVSRLLTPRKLTSDLYIALYSKNIIDLSRIQQGGGKIEKDEEHFNFGELLNILDENEFSSVLISAKPKSE